VELSRRFFRVLLRALDSGKTLVQHFGFSLPAVFIAIRNETVESETSKAERWFSANHGSI
jgi:hypothetical protein